MVFWYFRTMFLRLVEGGELELCEARSRCYTWLLVRSKANFNRLQQVSQMRRIPTIVFLAAERFDVFWVHQHQIETSFQYIPHRLPINTSRFHDHVGHFQFC